MEEITQETIIQHANDKTYLMETLADRDRAALLEFASEELRNDKELVLQAVKYNGIALEFASDALKAD